MVKVAVLGAGGGIGQPLSLLTKLDSRVTELSLYDIRGAPGVAADLSHVNTQAKVTGYQPASPKDESQLQKALTGCDIVIIPAGVPRKPGMTRADLFKINAGIIKGLVTGVAKFSPNAILLVISNPVNSTVPIAAETLKQYGVFNPEKLFGITTLDLVRAETFLAQLLKINPAEVKGKISVVGGHSGDTIVPLVQSTPLGKQVARALSSDQYSKYINRVQFGGDEVVNAKQGAGSATLSMAYAGYRFAELVISALTGTPSYDSSKIPEPAFVYLPGLVGGKAIAQQAGVDFFAVPVVFGAGASVKTVINPLEGLTGSEKKLVEVALKGLKPSIKKGEDFVKGAAKL
ncbi:malate dehydrogenase [Saccharomycopsis crataegensis]|uniref:Malate dehydrogenase n=1 Tax=Saccharomycopsis crataegensis TaxID=43959 RepID=A0AAV5QK26_9ASCO|nr:malate dehydrogenase [Saccharomycopsis crataegensis]